MAVMTFNSEILGLPKGTETLLRDLVHEKTGMFFDTTKIDMLMDKLAPLVVKRGFSSFLDYYYLLKYDEDALLEWGNVMNSISVGETYFWREIDQVKALVEVVVPNWHALHPHRTLRIWSAACATGEEPLSIAMALEESHWFERLSIEISASDASSASIEKAKKGIYRERSFRSLSDERRSRYFSAADMKSWQVDPALHRRIQYSVANLMNAHEIATLAEADVIFCRNVFIYFSEMTISRTVRSFARFMPSPAYLFVGSAESLMRLTTDFSLEEVDDAFVYIKEAQ